MRRRGGTSRVTYPLPELEPVLSETLGILVYQEQVMRIAQMVAGYSLAEADLLRKAIGKKKREIMQAEAEKFIRQGGRARHAQEEGAGALVADRAVRPIRVQQVPRRGLRARGLQDGLPQGALSDRLLRREPLGGDRLDRRHREGPRRLSGVRDPGPPAGHQRVFGELRRGRRGDPLRPRGHQGRRRGGGPLRPRGAGQAALRLLLRLHRAARLAPRQQADARRPHRGGRLRFAGSEPGDARGRVGARPRPGGAASRGDRARPVEPVRRLGAERRGRLDARRLSRAARSGRSTRSSRAKRTRSASTSRGIR